MARLYLFASMVLLCALYLVYLDARRPENCYTAMFDLQIGCIVIGFLLAMVAVSRPSMKFFQIDPTRANKLKGLSVAVIVPAIVYVVGNAIVSEIATFSVCRL